MVGAPGEPAMACPPSSDRWSRGSTPSTNSSTSQGADARVLFSTAGVHSSGIRSRGWEKLPCDEMNLLRRHHPRLLARFDAAPPPNRSGP